MELSIPYQREPNYNKIKLVLTLLIATVLASYISYRVYSYFNDCFSQNGIKEIYVTQGNKFVRTCELPDGKVLAQRLSKTVEGWEVDYVYLADSIEDIPQLLLRVYPGGRGALFQAYVEELLKFFP